MTDVDIYINWAMHAIVGYLGEADALMRVAGTSIQRVAGVLRQKHPIEDKPLYRGALLDPSAPFKPDSRTFWSFSEDRDVACWFGHPKSMISEPLAASNPSLCGFVFTLPQTPWRVLFHYSWATKAFGGFTQFARLHPFIGEEGARQIAWSLRTQKEVIIEPLPQLPPAKPIASFDVSLAALDEKLTPPWAERLS